eukprot:6958280-Pyramimonas_sp.AAC.1
MLSLYVCTTGDTTLAAAAARTPVTHVTILVARRPYVRIADLVVCFHQDCCWSCCDVMFAAHGLQWMHAQVGHRAKPIVYASDATLPHAPQGPSALAEPMFSVKNWRLQSARPIGSPERMASNRAGM